MDRWRATVVRGICTAVALLGAVAVAVPAGAESDPRRDISAFACPDVAGVDPFVDVAGNGHADAIHCAAAHGFVQGRSPDRYEPAATLTRAQAATVLFRLLDLADVPMDPTAESFDDIAGDVHELRIRAIASVGVVRGITETSFGPDRPVTRGQLASMVANAVVTTGAFLTIGGDAFDDDAGSPHEVAIDALASNGIVEGTGLRRFEPGSPVRRDAMASILMRATDFAIENGGLRSPFADAFRAATLTPGAVVEPHGDTDAAGEALLWTQPQGDLVCFEIGTTDVGPAGQDHPERAAYLAAGAPGEAGAVLVELPPPSAANAVPEGFDAWSAGCVRTDPAIVQRLVSEPEELYVGVATFADDEVLRGQLGVVPAG